MIAIDHLRVSYPKANKMAVDGLSLHVKKGEIYGLLGPNGAGKTSTIKVICGLMTATSGEVKVMAHPINSSKKTALSNIGLAPQEIALYPSLTAKENLRFIGEQYGIESNILAERIDLLLTRFELSGKSGEQVQNFSGGMKRRLNLIASLLHTPSILILDEPTTGVDVQSRAIIHDFLKSENEKGLTIVYTSHHLDEAERLCQRVGIVDHGKLLVEGTPQELLAKHDCPDLESVFISLTGRQSRDH
jgi:ABC-2 type transport system ATP-binding protein